jgi:hypothetical protein
MKRHYDIEVPTQLPFLKAVCWDMDNVHMLNIDEMLNRYERGWANKGVLADLNKAEKLFVAKIAKEKGSWLQLDV